MKGKILLLLGIILLGMCNCKVTNEVARPTATIDMIPTGSKPSTMQFTSTMTSTYAPPPDTAAGTRESFEKYQTFLENAWLAEYWEKAMTQFDMNICAGQQVQQSESMVNQFLEEYERVLDDEARKKLQQVQILWEDYKQQDCQRVFESYNGGTIGPMNKGLCWDMHNRHRLESLLAELKAG